MSNDESRMSNAGPAERVFDLEERTVRFAVSVVLFCKSLQRDPIDLILIRQLVRAATSIGANYCEADDAESRKDFLHKIGLCKKEARETQYWLRLLKAVLPGDVERIEIFKTEARELHLIFAAIRRRTAEHNVGKD